MNIKDQINQDCKNAIKAQDELKSTTLRMLKSALHNEVIKKQDELNDAEICNILNKEVKKREEARKFYLQGNRKELAEKEEKEIEIIKKYLPAQLGDDEIEKEVMATIKTIGASGMQDFGKVMKELMPKLKGRVPGDKVSEILKNKLGGS